MIDCILFNKNRQYLNMFVFLACPLTLELASVIWHMSPFKIEGSISIAIYLCQFLAKLFNSHGPEEMVAVGFVCSCSCKSQDRTGFRALFESIPCVSLNKWVSLTNAGNDDFLISIALLEG